MYATYTEYLRDLMLNEETRIALDKALSTYPLYASDNESIRDLIPTREKLNEKLLNHYKYREIGFETVGRFLDELEITMIEIMPRYNELFKTVEIMAGIEDPFGNVNVTETFEQETTNTSTSEGTDSRTGSATAENTSESSVALTNNANSKQIESDTPQDQITVGADNISDVTYASKADWAESNSQGSESRETSDSSQSSNTSEGSTTGKSDSSGTLKHTFTKVGNQGVNTYAHDMNEFRTSIIDVVDQIINDERLGELFMMVY